MRCEPMLAQAFLTCADAWGHVFLFAPFPCRAVRTVAIGCHLRVAYLPNHTFQK